MLKNSGVMGSVLLLALGFVACAQSQVEKSTGTNWISCGDDDDCVDVPEARCGTNGVCVDHHGDPVRKPGSRGDAGAGGSDAESGGNAPGSGGTNPASGGDGNASGAVSNSGGADASTAGCWTPEEPDLAFAFPESGCSCAPEDAGTNPALCVFTFAEGYRNVSCATGKWTLRLTNLPCTCTSDAQCGFGGLCSDGNCGMAACEVDGVKYAAGVSGIPDPFSCNLGTCTATGFVPTTEAICEEQCPAGTTAATACLDCGPLSCALFRTGCLPRCNDSSDCAAPLQCDPLDNVCRMFCL